jgi:hypothetical protein
MKERLNGIGRRSLRTVSQIAPPRTLYFTLPWPSRNLLQSLPQWRLFRTSNSSSRRFNSIHVNLEHQCTGVRPPTERADLPLDAADAKAQGETAYKIGFSGAQRFVRGNLACHDSYVERLGKAIQLFERHTRIRNSATCLAHSWWSRRARRKFRRRNGEKRTMQLYMEPWSRIRIHLASIGTSSRKDALCAAVLVSPYRTRNWLRCSENSIEGAS